MRKDKGFTLVELMIVVAIIAILAAIAIPMYTGYVKKAKISEAITNIDAIKSAVTVYYQTKGSLPSSLDDLGVTLDTTKWDYSISTANNTITIKATAKSTLGDLSGGYIQITGSASGGSLSWGSFSADGTKIKSSDLP